MLYTQYRLNDAADEEVFFFGTHSLVSPQIRGELKAPKMQTHCKLLF